MFVWPVCCADDTVPLLHRLLLLAVPLLFPLIGLLKGKAYTFAWSHFLALFYFILSVIVLWQNDEPIYGLALLFGSMTWFTFALLYIRSNARDIKAKNPDAY